MRGRDWRSWLLLLEVNLDGQDLAGDRVAFGAFGQGYLGDLHFGEVLFDGVNKTQHVVVGYGVGKRNRDGGGGEAGRRRRGWLGWGTGGGSASAGGFTEIDGGDANASLCGKGVEITNNLVLILVALAVGHDAVGAFDHVFVLLQAG